jgi:hypothetical protein
MNISIVDITNVKALPKQYAYLPNIRGSRKQCLAWVEQYYPWLDGAQAWYHAPTATLFLPVEFLRTVQDA